MSSRFRFFFTVAMLVVSVAVIGSSFESPKMASAGSAKVTICHRTHSTTNPYRKITVAKSSLTKARGHNVDAHDEYSNVIYTVAKPVPNVFDSSVDWKSFSATEKLWGDIIPILDVESQVITPSAELNFTNGPGLLRGLDIYNGTGDFAGLCGKMSAAAFYKSEVEAGVVPAEILADLEDQEHDDDATALSTCGGQFAGCTIAKLEEAEALTDPTTEPTTAPTTEPTTAPTTEPTTAPTTEPTTAPTTEPTTAPTTEPTTAPGTTGTLEGIVWLDSNRNGTRDKNEPFLKNTKVVASKASSTPLSGKSDAKGFYRFLNVDPGTWTVTAEQSIEELEVVYDSTGEADWIATAVVKTNGVGKANFAAAGSSTITLTLPKASAASVVANWGGSDRTFCSNDDISFAGTASNGTLKLQNVPSGSYRVGSSDPCDDGATFVLASVTKGSAVTVAFTPALPATGSNNGLLPAIVAFLLLAFGVVFRSPLRRLRR